jgi:glycosyltransferase involved in cell wall biosynthesis
LASAINDLLGDPEKLADLTAAGRERVLESYTYGRNAERYAGFYAADD